MRDAEKEPPPTEEFLMELKIVERGKDDGSLQLTTRTFPRQADAVTSPTMVRTSKRTLCIRAPHWRGRPRQVVLRGNMEDKARGEALHRSWNISTKRRGKPSHFNTPINLGGDAIIVMLDGKEVAHELLPWALGTADLGRDDIEERKKHAHGKEFAKKSRRVSGYSRSEAPTHTGTHRKPNDCATTKSPKQKALVLRSSEKNPAANIPNEISHGICKNGSPGFSFQPDNVQASHTSTGQDISAQDPLGKSTDCSKDEAIGAHAKHSKISDDIEVKFTCLMKGTDSGRLDGNGISKK